MNEYLRITAASTFLGICTETMRRWEKKGLVACEWNSQGQRIFEKAELLRIKTERERNGLRK